MMRGSYLKKSLSYVFSSTLVFLLPLGAVATESDDDTWHFKQRLQDVGFYTSAHYDYHFSNKAPGLSDVKNFHEDAAGVNTTDVLMKAKKSSTARSQKYEPNFKVKGLSAGASIGLMLRSLRFEAEVSYLRVVPDNIDYSDDKDAQYLELKRDAYIWKKGTTIFGYVGRLGTAATGPLNIFQVGDAISGTGALEEITPELVSIDSVDSLIGNSYSPTIDSGIVMIPLTDSTVKGSYTSDTTSTPAPGSGQAEASPPSGAVYLATKTYADADDSMRAVNDQWAFRVPNKKMEFLSTMLNVLYSLKMGRISPYVGMGCGWTRVGAFNITKDTVGYQVKAGIDLSLASNLALRVGYTFFGIFPTELQEIKPVQKIPEIMNNTVPPAGAITSVSASSFGTGVGDSASTQFVRGAYRMFLFPNQNRASSTASIKHFKFYSQMANAGIVLKFSTL